LVFSLQTWFFVREYSWEIHCFVKLKAYFIKSFQEVLRLWHYFGSTLKANLCQLLLSCYDDCMFKVWQNVYSDESALNRICNISNSMNSSPKWEQARRAHCDFCQPRFVNLEPIVIFVNLEPVALFIVCPISLCMYPSIVFSKVQIH